MRFRLGFQVIQFIDALFPRDRRELRLHAVDCEQHNGEHVLLDQYDRG